MEDIERTSTPIWIYADVVCDIFHYGHVEFFRAARALGDRLIVGLVGDEQVATYKPAPIMTHAERVATVRGCKYVDKVLEFPPPLHCTTSFLDEIGAQFCCHGNDMTQSELAFWYGDLLSSNRLRTVHYTLGVSSRDIVSRIVRRWTEGSLRPIDTIQTPLSSGYPKE